MMMNYAADMHWRRLLGVIYWIIVVLTIGTVGYWLVEGWSLTDSFYMTVITISTVGYGETNVLSEQGRWFTAFLIFLSLVSMTVATATLTSFIVEGDLSGQLEQSRALKRIAAMKNHTIVCGTGLMALAVIERLLRKRADVVVIDKDEAKLAVLKKQYRRIEIVPGEPTNELVLAKANLLDAKNVVAATESDIDNLLIGITCRDLGEDICVIAESNDVGIANRMRKSGIEEVISPAQLGGQQIAEFILT